MGKSLYYYSGGKFLGGDVSYQAGSETQISELVEGS